MVVVKYWFHIASISLVFSLQTFAAKADDDAALQLSQHLQATNDLVAVFSQTSFDEAGRQVDFAQGELALAKPNVRWEVSEPFPQTILLTGDDLRIFDPDLEQVTQRNVSDTWGQVPLALLTRADADISALFNVQKIPDSMAVIYDLTPKQAQAGFERINIAFLDGVLQHITVEDPFGQRTHIEFKAHISSQIEPQKFELDVPEGTEFIQG